MIRIFANHVSRDHSHYFKQIISDAEEKLRWTDNQMFHVSAYCIGHHFNYKRDRLLLMERSDHHKFIGSFIAFAVTLGDVGRTSFFFYHVKICIRSKLPIFILISIFYSP